LQKRAIQTILAMLITLAIIMPLAGSVAGNVGPLSPAVWVIHVQNARTNGAIQGAFVHIYREPGDIEIPGSPFTTGATGDTGPITLADNTQYAVVVSAANYQTKTDNFNSGIGANTRTENLQPQVVGGVVVAIDKVGMLTPYIGLASVGLVATAGTVVFARRRKKK